MIDPTLPLQIRHRDLVWNVEAWKLTIYHNYAITFGDGQFMVIVDKEGWPIENQYGFEYKEYRVFNTPAEVPTP